MIARKYERIAVDTSVLIALFMNEESKGLNYNSILQDHSCLIGWPTCLEFCLVMSRSFKRDRAVDLIEWMSGFPNVEMIPFGRSHFDAANEAFLRFGKGRGHPAQLNFGDCLSYAVAKVTGVPLLFKGNDFRHTDIQPARP